MKAAMLIRPGEIVLRDVPDPEPGPDDVRIVVGGVGLCGSDQALYRGRWIAPRYPWIMGHEAFGHIDAVGANVAADRVGQLVVIEPNAPCFDCLECARGLTSACVNRQSVGMNRDGALAERLVIPSVHAWGLSSVSAEDLVGVEPLVVCEAALRRVGGALPGSAAVIGVGSQGLLMVLSLVGRGLSVYVHDLSPARIKLAVDLGARPLPVGTGMSKVALIVDTAGTPSSLKVALDYVEAGGTILVLSLDSTPLDISANTLVRRQLVFRGSLTYDHPSDFGTTVRRVRDHAILPSRVISNEYPFWDVQHAFESSMEVAGKTWIRVASSMSI